MIVTVVGLPDIDTQSIIHLYIFLKCKVHQVFLFKYKFGEKITYIISVYHTIEVYCIS